MKTIVKVYLKDEHGNKDWFVTPINLPECDNIHTEREEGRAEGLVKGREEEKRENARNLKRLGVLSDIISQATGLSKNEIEEL